MQSIINNMHRTHMYIIYHLLTPLYTFSHLYTLTHSFSQSLPVTDEKPTLHQLLRLNFPFGVEFEDREKLYYFGIHLLDNDQMMNSMGDPKNFTFLILRHWLAGEGRDVTWEVLIEALRRSRFIEICRRVETALRHFRNSK